MLKRKLLAAVALSFCFCVSSFAAKVASSSDEKSITSFTLDSYINAYIQNSPEIVRQYNNLQTSKIQYQNEIINLFLPSAGANMGTTLFSKENPGLHFDAPYDASVSVDWNIFNSGRDYLSYKKAKNNLEISQIRFNNMLQDTILSAIRTFYDFKLKESLLAVAKNDIEDKKEQFEMTEYLYKDGLRAYSDLLQSENNYKNSQLRLAEQTASYTSALIAFNNTVNRDINAPVVLEYELGAPAPLYTTDFDDDLETAIRYREDINTAILNLQNSKISNKLTLMNNLPMLSASAAFGNSTEDVFGESRNNTSYSVGLSLSVPIGFFWVDKYNDVRVSKLELVNSYMDFDSMLRKIKEDVSGARTNLMLQFAGIEISENNLKIAKERLDITREKYRDGSASALDLSQAQDEYLSAQNNDTTYKYNYQLDQYSYRRTLGLDVYDAGTVAFDTKAFSDAKIKQIDKEFINNKKR